MDPELAKERSDRPSTAVAVAAGLSLIAVAFGGAVIIAATMPDGTARPFILSGLAIGGVGSALVLVMGVRRVRRGAATSRTRGWVAPGTVTAGAGIGMLLGDGPAVAVLVAGGVFFCAILGLVIAEKLTGWPVRGSKGGGPAG